MYDLAVKLGELALSFGAIFLKLYGKCLKCLHLHKTHLSAQDVGRGALISMLVFSRVNLLSEHPRENPECFPEFSPRRVDGVPGGRSSCHSLCHHLLLVLAGCSGPGLRLPAPGRPVHRNPQDQVRRVRAVGQETGRDLGRPALVPVRIWPACFLKLACNPRRGHVQTRVDSPRRGVRR